MYTVFSQIECHICMMWILKILKKCMYYSYQTFYEFND